MEAKLMKWTIIGVFVVFVLASAWHFLYDVLPCNFTGAISPVNESPWEHAKLFFVPAIIWYTIQYFIVGKEFPNYVFAHAVALLVMPVFMLLFYYLYQSLLEETFVLDIINSFLTISLGAFVAYKLTVSEHNMSSAAHHIIAMVIIIGMLTLYITFTFNPPLCDMFRDSETMQYGI